MLVSISETNETSVYHGTTYYFCKPMCKEEFEADPGNFLNTTDENTATDPYVGCQLTTYIPGIRNEPLNWISKFPLELKRGQL